MAKGFTRSDRVAEQVQRELADLLQFGVKDPRVGMVTITAVEVTGDMAHAKIFYSAKKESKETQLGLEKAAGFLRGQLAKRMMLRVIPQLHFAYDASLDYGIKMSNLIDIALKSDKNQSDDVIIESILGEQDQK